MDRSGVVGVVEKRGRLIVAGLIVLAFALGVWAGPAYRRSDWSHWITRNGCQDTRQKVLIRDAIPSPEGLPANERDLWQPLVMSEDTCRVLAGTWRDPYVGRLVFVPASLDVDHVVALGEAYRSGGAGWSPARKREYANDLTWPGHLWAVLASANREKSDRDPTEWVPERKEAWCEYGLRRAAIKWVEGLTGTPAERRVVKTVLLATCASGGTLLRDP